MLADEMDSLDTPRKRAPQPAIPTDAPVRVSAVLMTLMLGLLERHALGEREQDVLQLVLLGRDIDTIAHRLRISPTQVRWALNSVFVKTGARSRDELVRLALRRAQEIDPSLSCAAAPTTPPPTARARFPRSRS